MSLIPAFLIGFGSTVMLVPLVGRVARAAGLVAEPSADRWHRRSVPHVGGISMLLPLILVMWLGGLLPAFWPLAAACVLMFGLGLVDDVWPVRPSTKFAAQTLIAAALLWQLPALGLTGSPVLDLLIGFLWIVGITNAMNLLDNIDGLAAGVAGIAGAFLLAAWLQDGAGSAAPLGVAIAAFVGVTAGFLLFNFHPATIFMGDGGSHLLGIFLAGATLTVTAGRSSQIAPVAAVPVLLLLIPIFDTAFVMVGRGLAGRSAFLGGRDHTSHRLVALGIGERRAVLVLYGLCAIGGLVALSLLFLPGGIAWPLVGTYVAGLVFIGLYLGHIEAARGPLESLPPLPTEFTTRYRSYEVLLDAVILGAAYYLAYLARFREPEFTRLLPYFVSTFPIVVALQIAALWVDGKYRAVWGEVGPREMLGLVRGSLMGVIASVVAVLYLTRFEGYSRLVFAFDALLAPVLLIAARVTFNGLDQYLRVRRTRGRTALIYGAGRAGALAVRELLQNSSIGLSPIGFMDDDPAKRRLRMDGLAVVTSFDHLAAYLDQSPGRVGAIVVAIGSLSPERFDALCAICASREVAVQRMRFSIEDVRRRAGSEHVVAFPRQPAR